MLKSIRLINWRSHADSALDFRGGTNILIGIMGSGKSSVLEAISFALFGTFPALERRKLKMEDIIRLDKPEAKVALDFGWDGTTYRVVRTIERKKKGGTSSSAEVFKDNSSVESGSTAATSYIETLTSLDYDLFTRAIYSEQNNIDYFLNLEPRRRKQEMDALLGLDKFETARANAVTVAGRIRSKRQGMEGRFSKEKLKSLQEKEKKHQEEIASAAKALKKAAEESEKHQKELKSLSADFEGMRKNKELYEKLDKEITRLSAQQESLKKEVEEGRLDEKALQESKDRLSALSEKRKKLSASAKALDEKSTQLSKEAGSLDARLKAGSDAKERLKASAEALSKMLGGKKPDELAKQQKEAENNFVSMESESKSLERDIKEISELMGKLRPGLSECPLCSSKLAEDGVAHIKSEKEALVKKKQARIKELSKLLTDAKKQADELREKSRNASLLSEKIASLEKECAGLGELAPKKKGIESEMSKIKDEKKETEAALDKAAKESEKLQLEIAKCEGAMKKKQQLEQLEKKLADTKKQLSSVKFNEKTFEELRRKTEESRLQLERLLSSKKSSEEQLKMSKDLLKMVAEELSEMKALSEHITHYSALEEQLLIYKNALLETQTSLRSTLTDAINSAMNEIWPIFYPYRNYHALRLNVSERDYVFEVNDGADWKVLESMASGGERASAALTLRVALAMVLTPKLSWLILDEPTHNLDTEAVHLLSHALQYKVPEVVKQTFVITHEEGLMGSEFASSYRLSRDKINNGETKIEPA